MGGGGKSSTSTQTVSIPPEVLARYNAVNARAESVAQQPFQQYGGEFVAPLTPTQTAGIEATSKASQLAQPYYGAATGAAIAGAMPVNPQGLQVGQYMNPFTQSVVGATQAAMGQQQGQQLAQQQAESIRAGAFGGDRAGLQRQALRGQQGLAQAQAIAPLYQQGYQQALQTAQQQQGVGLGAQQANRQAVQQLSQQLGGLGTGAQQAALQGAQAQIGAGTLQQQTQQAQDTAQYQQFLQQRGYDFQVAQFLANIAMGTGALSGSTTTSTQPRGFFSNRGGFKTGESLHRSGKAYGGGLDPNSMGGAVYEPGAFERGGYALSGSVVDPTDLNAILAQQQSFQSPRGGVGPYGQAPGAAPHGPSGIVPQQRMHVPKLITAGAPPKAAPGAGSELSKIYSLANEATTGLTGKGLTERAGEKMGLRGAPKGANDVDVKDAGQTRDLTESEFKNLAKPSSSVAPDASTAASNGGFGDFISNLNPFKSEGGGIMPRHHYADGGGDDSQADEAIPYDPSDVQGGKDPMEGVLKAGTQRPQLKTAGGGGGGSGGGGLGSDLMKGAGLISAGKTLYSAGSGLASFLPTLFLADGGVVPRQHFDEGGDAEQPVRKYFDYLTKEKGYEPHVAAGILGNAYHESGGLQPGIVGDQGKSIGLFQFHEKGEQPAFRQWASENQRSISDPYAQIDFVHNQLQGPYAKTLEQMRSAADPSSAAESFMRGYERPKEGPTAALDRRQAYANAIASGEKLPTFRAYAGNQGGLGGAGQEAIQRATSGEGRGLGAGQEQPGFFDRNKGIILPVLQGIGAMASSKSISPWAAALQGLGAGAKAYGDVGLQQAQTDESRARQIRELSGIPVGPRIGQIGPDGKPVFTSRTDFYGGSISDAAKKALQRSGIQTSILGDQGPTKEGQPSAPQGPIVPRIGPGGSYTYEIQPGAEADRQLSQYGQNPTVIRELIGQQPELAKKAEKDQDMATSKTMAAQAAPTTTADLNNLSKAINQVSEGTITGQGPGQADRARRVAIYNWAVQFAGLPGGAIDTGTDLTDADIIKKIQTMAGAQRAEAGNFRAGYIASALAQVQPDASMSREAANNLLASMYIQKQMDQDFQKYYSRYVERYGTSLNVHENFERDMRPIYNRDKTRIEHALNAVDRDVRDEKTGKVVKMRQSPADIVRSNPAAAPEFEKRYGSTGMSRYFVGG